jgi:hypothetical protein
MEGLLAAALCLMLAWGVMSAWIEDPWAFYVLCALIFGMGGAWATTRMVVPKPVRFTVPAILLGVVACWGGIQLASGSTVNRWETMNAGLLWTANLVVYFVALQLFAEKSRRERFLRWLLYGGVALAAEALLQLYTADRKVFWVFRFLDQGKVVMGPVSYHNHYAAIVALVLPIAAHSAFRNVKSLLTRGWMVGLLVGSVFASESRAGSALVLLELAVLLLFAGGARRPRVRLAMGAVLLLFVVAGGVVAGWERLWVRLHESDHTRIAASMTSLEMVRQRPIAGDGLGTWPTVYPMFAHFDDGLFMNQAHNDWLQWAVEGGWPLAAVFACLAAWTSVPAFRWGWGLGIPAVFLLCLVDFPLQKPVVCFLLFALAGAAGAARPPGASATASSEPHVVGGQ